MATEKWIAGGLQGLTWANAFTGSTLNSIANGNAILSDLTFNNATALDMFADLSISLASAAFVSPNFVGVYLYPLNQDGTTYGDGRFATSAAGPPPSTYFAGTIGLVAATQAQVGLLRGILLPPGSFKYCLMNRGGIAFAASGNVALHRTYNRQVV